MLDFATNAIAVNEELGKNVRVRVVPCLLLLCGDVNQYLPG